MVIFHSYVSSQRRPQATGHETHLFVFLGFGVGEKMIKWVILGHLMLYVALFVFMFMFNMSSLLLMFFLGVILGHF